MILSILGPDEIFGEISVSIAQKRNEVAEVIEDGNRQTVTSIFKKLEKQNVISYTRKFLIIKNIDGLK